MRQRSLVVSCECAQPSCAIIEFEECDGLKNRLGPKEKVGRGVVGKMIEAFRAKGVLVGRPFPPMVQHLRVSVGTGDEMNRFLKAFREIAAS